LIIQGTSGKQLDSFGAIGDGAEVIANNCILNMGIEEMTSGQVFYNDDWSVVVEGVSDCH